MYRFACKISKLFRLRTPQSGGGHWHNTQRRRTCERHKHVNALGSLALSTLVTIVAGDSRRCGQAITQQERRRVGPTRRYNKSTTNRSNAVCAYSRRK